VIPNVFAVVGDPVRLINASIDAFRSEQHGQPLRRRFAANASQKRKSFDAAMSDKEIAMRALRAVDMSKFAGNL
jgi:hypothetical protein